MSALAIIGIWLGFAALNIGIAWWNDHVRRVRIRLGDPKQIEHLWYGLGYSLLCGGVWYRSRSWIDFFSILLLHISVFTIAYNRFSDNPAFNLSRTSKALSDRLLVSLGFKSYEFVAVSAFCISVVLFILQLFPW
jgi:hypothetical protein